MNPRVRPCEPLCGLLRVGAASLPQRGISSRFRANFRGFPRLCGGRKKKQDKGLASLPPFRPDTSARRADSLRGVFSGVEGGACWVGVYGGWRHSPRNGRFDGTFGVPYHDLEEL